MERSERLEQRKRRMEQLEQLSLEEIGKIRPYQENAVTATLPDANNPELPSKAEMIETILSHEGLGLDRF